MSAEEYEGYVRYACGELSEATCDGVGPPLCSHTTAITLKAQGGSLRSIYLVPLSDSDEMREYSNCLSS